MTQHPLAVGLDAGEQPERGSRLVLVSHGALFIPHRASHRVYAHTGRTSTTLTDLVGGRVA